ncbi:MAG: carboxylesterase/lipase family protein [Caulobacterales bacterium]|jgi:para-nitrobenzyl esterase
MIRTFAAALIACAVSLSAAAQARPERVVSTGALAGVADGGAEIWRGIPFAAPPVGELRWRAPRKPAAWQGRRDATKPAPWCPQVLSALDGAPRKEWGKLVGQEDCLTLDVYAPFMRAAEAKTAKLPVMVWIHGGSNVWGRSQQYNASELAARERVVVVVAQYRLGPLGWFAHSALRANPQIPDDESANFAQLDHVRALEWVRDEIGVFGGDPARVTIFGESAGGQNVAALLVSPRAKGLFHRAIVQSGSLRSEPLAKAEGADGDAMDTGRGIATRLLNGAPASGAALRAAPLAAIYKAYDSTREGRDLPRVIADGVTLPKDGIEAALADPARRISVPTILGSTRDEMKLFNALNPALSKRAFGVFPQARDPVLFEAMSLYPSRNWRATAVDRPAAVLTATGNADVWTYRFDWADQGRFLLTDLSQMLGAAHSMEIPFVFGHFQFFGAFDRYMFTRENEAGRFELSNQMMSAWGAFAHSGDPGGDWARYQPTGAAPSVMLFNARSAGGSRMIADRESQARLIADLFADQTLKTNARRCQVFKVMLAWNKEMVGMDDGRCAAKAAVATR